MLKISTVPDSIEIPRHKASNKRAWYIDTDLNGSHVQFILDTGCTHTCIPETEYLRIPDGIRPTLITYDRATVTGFDGSGAPVVGLGVFCVTLGDLHINLPILVVRGLQICLLGMDFCTKYRVQFKWKAQEIVCHRPLGPETYPALNLLDTPSNLVVPTSFHCFTLDTDTTIPDHIQPIVDSNSDRLDQSQMQKLTTILLDNQDVFVKSSQELGTIKQGMHIIDTGDHAPIKDPARRIAPHKKKIVEENVTKGRHQNEA